MSAIKGCINPACTACQKRRIYKKEDEFCSVCGEKLQYVCKKCHKQLPDNTQKYCALHLAEREEKARRLIDTAKKAGMAVMSAGSSIALAAVTHRNITKKQ